MKLLEFGRSTILFRIDLDVMQPRTLSHKPPFAMNNARIQIDSVCRITERDGGRRHTFVLGSDCTTERVGAAISTLQAYGISQLPVSEEPEGDDVVGLVGSISEKGLLDRAYRDPSVVERTVGEVMDAPLPLVEVSATLDEAFALLSGGANALVAVRSERPAGVVTKLDILEYLAHHPVPSG